MADTCSFRGLMTRCDKPVFEKLNVCAYHATKAELVEAIMARDIELFSLRKMKARVETWAYTEASLNKVRREMEDNTDPARVGAIRELFLHALDLFIDSEAHLRLASKGKFVE